MTEDIDIIASEARDLTADPAATGEKTFGRKDEVQALARTLASGKSAVLVGPTGVGKTAIVQKLLAYLAEARLPELAHAKIYEISTVGLCSDTRFTGQQEERIRAMLAHATRRRLHYIPDIWNLPYAGSYSTNPRGIYDLMRPGIEQGKLVLFGEVHAGPLGQARRASTRRSLRDFVAHRDRGADRGRDARAHDARRRGHLAARSRSRPSTASTRSRRSSCRRRASPARASISCGARPRRRRQPVERRRRATRRPIDASFVEAVFAKQTRPADAHDLAAACA